MTVDRLKRRLPIATAFAGMIAALIALTAGLVSAQTPAPVQTSTPVPAASPDGLSFEQVYELAARDNLHINAIRRHRAVAEAGVLIAGERPNPDLISGYTRSEPRLNVSVSQPIETAGKRGKRLAVARNELLLSELELDAALRTLRRDLRGAYFNLALTKNRLGLGRQAVAQAQVLADIAQERFDAGDIAQFEVLQAKLEVARATNELSKLENNERVALATVNQLLNRPPQAPLDLQQSLFGSRTNVSVPVLIEHSLSENVELRTAAQQIATEKSRLKLARAQRIPDLLLEPGIETIDSSLANNYGVKMQVTVSLPIFNRGRGEIARSNALIDQLTAERDDTRQRISAEIGQFALKLDSAREQVEFYETKLLPDAERVRAMAVEAYRAGQTGILPVQDAERNAREVKQAYLQALFDYQSALADLEQAAGVKLN